MVGSRDDFFPTRGERETWLDQGMTFFPTKGEREQITPWTNRRTPGVRAFYGWAGNASSSHFSDEEHTVSVSDEVFSDGAIFTE